MKGMIVVGHDIDPLGGRKERPQLNMVVGELHSDRRHFIRGFVRAKWQQQFAHLLAKIFRRYLLISRQALKGHHQLAIASKLVILALFDPVLGLSPKVGNPPVDEVCRRIGMPQWPNDPVAAKMAKLKNN